MKKSKAFTLIELISVLVILAILALIVTPLVLNIIKKARTAADKRSIDAYGRSIELAIADYLLDKGSFPTSIEELTIEYTGDKVECTTEQLKDDGSVYLSECTVAGREVTGYTYGKGEETPAPKAYSVGNEVTYNGVDYYVIADSAASESTVTLLKAEPLTVAEVNQYGGVGTANNHVNMYNVSSSQSWYQTAYNFNGYGGMAYYSSATCNEYGDVSECITDYEESDIKYVVDAWKNAEAPAASEARLITFEYLIENFGFEIRQVNPIKQGYAPTENTPTWLYNSNYGYWTMSKYNDSSSYVWLVGAYGYLSDSTSVPNRFVVRPVIVINKSALS